jgi:hypothetical protein
MGERTAAEPDLEPRGIRKLRIERGLERASFDEIADHLHDFSIRYPYATPVVDQVAAFLARVERISHDHVADETTTEAKES